MPGDGIDKNVVQEGIRILNPAARIRLPVEIEREFDWSCEKYAQTARMLPADGLEYVPWFDSMFLGAVGCPVFRTTFRCGAC